MLRAPVEPTDRTAVARGLQIAVGVAFVISGAEALVAPTRFVQGVLAPYGRLAAGMPLWGIAFVAIGGCLIAIGVLHVGRRAVTATSVCAAVMLFLVSALRLTALAWADAVLYGCTALAVVAAAFLPGSLARTWLHVRRQLGQTISTIARVLMGLALIGLGTPAAVRHDWATAALYFSLGAAVVLAPGLVPAQPLSLWSVRVRLVAMTVILTSGALILATLAIAASAEATAIGDALADQQLTASEVAYSLTDGDSEYRGLVTTLAMRGGLAQLDRAQQRALLQGLTATNVYAFSTYDSTGAPVARSDERPLEPLPAQILLELQQSRAAGRGLATVPGTNQPALFFVAPYVASGGDVAGYAAAELDLEQLSHAVGALASVGRHGTSVFVLDANGTPILHPSPTSPDAATRPPALEPTDSTQTGSLRYRVNGAEYAAAYTQVPALDWSVVSAYPLAYVLAGVQNGREWAFGALILAAALSAGLGLFLADRVVAPLDLLGNAMDDLAAEATATPLPRSDLAEVQRLTGLFAAMRERLVARTTERQNALDSAREAIRVRDEFMSIAAHELKTPITATRGHAQLLLAHLRDGDRIDPARLRSSLERINSQSQKLARLIDQLLDVARLEHGILIIRPARFDLRELIDEVLVDRTDRDRIVVRAPHAPVIVDADFGRLEQVLSNLLDNAVKFSPEHAGVEVDLCLTAGPTARLTVRDHGLGIPPEHRAHIFERFHQAHADTHRSGFGLGLYIARQIVELHNGTIDLESPTSGGTLVRVDLPHVHAGDSSVRQIG